MHDTVHMFLTRQRSLRDTVRLLYYYVDKYLLHSYVYYVNYVVRQQPGNTYLSSGSW